MGWGNGEQSEAEMMGCGLGVNLQTSGYLKTQAEKMGLSGVSRSMCTKKGSPKEQLGLSV